MGIVNATPDSFFPDSRTAATDEAIARGLSHFSVGADVVDVGGESTRPGAEPVEADEEIARVVPVVSALAARGVVSIDTQKPAVAHAAVAAGATIVNDVSSTLAAVAGELGVGYVGMHRQGDSRTMQIDPHYDDVVAEVEEFLAGVAESARSAGVRELWLDPGIGFGKTAEHNLALLAATDRFARLAAQFRAGLLIGTSRKRFLGTLSPEPLEVDDRLEGSIATEAWAIVHGATMIRAHDVAAAVQLRELVSRPVGEVTS
jgi:dihydropteroate synthase